MLRGDIKKYSTWYKIQSYLNALNHILNGAAAFFMTLYVLREGSDSFSWHAFLTTIGYQLLMAEAIMVFYTPNSWTLFHSYRTKKHLHWVLQLIAAIFIITGNIIISVIRTTPHFKTTHAVTGKEFVAIRKRFLTRLIFFSSRPNFDDFTCGYGTARHIRLLCTQHECDNETGYDQVPAQLYSHVVLRYRNGELDFRLSLRLNA